MKLVELMREVISNTMEKMFYTLVEFEGTDDSSSWKNMEKIASHVKLSSEKSALFIIIVLSEPFAFQMAADFVGVVLDKVKREDVEDCIKELANMIGGNCISSTIGKYSLELPKIGYPDEITINHNNCRNINMFVLGEKVGEVILCSVDT